MKKEIDKMLERFEGDSNKWQWLRNELARLGIKDESIVDSIQGFVNLMICEKVAETKENKL